MNTDDYRKAFEPAGDGGDLSRFTARPGDIFVYREENMQCRSCVNRMGLPLECEEYEQKPSRVLFGEPVCPDYVPDQKGERAEIEDHE